VNVMLAKSRLSELRLSEVVVTNAPELLRAMLTVKLYWVFVSTTPDPMAAALDTNAVAPVELVNAAVLPLVRSYKVPALTDPVLKAKYPSQPFVVALLFTLNRPKRKKPPPVPVTLAPAKVAEPVSVMASPAVARLMVGKLAYRFEALALSVAPLPHVGDAVVWLLRVVVVDVVAHPVTVAPWVLRQVPRQIKRLM